MSHLALCSILSIAIFAQAQSSPLTSQELTKLVAQLSSDNFAEREAATDSLWRAGPEAKSVLQAVLNGDDPEAVARAKGILERFRLGILPSTPPEIVRLIQRFSGANQSEQEEILTRLEREQQHRPLLALLRSVEDETRREHLARRFTVRGPQLVAAMLESGDREMVQDQLAFNAHIGGQHSRSARDYAAFLLLTGRLDAAVTDLQKSLDHNDEPSMRVLSRLLQLQGRLDDALAMAKKTMDRQLQADLYYRAEDWAALAASPPGDQGVERCGFEAAFHRLAGQQLDFELAVNRLISIGKERDLAWMSAEALAINDQWNAAIASVGAGRALSLRCFQLEPLQAFRELGIKDPRHDATLWFTQGEPKDFFLGIAVVKALQSLGERENARKLLDLVAANAEGRGDWREYNIIKTNLELDRREMAWQMAAAAMENEKIASSILFLLFPAREDEAQQWWQTLRTLAPEQDRSEALGRLKRLLELSPDSNLSALVKLSAEQAAKMTDAEGARRLKAIAELCARQGQYALAREYFNQQAKRIPINSENDPFSHEHPRVIAPLLRLGDMYAAEKEWLRAAHAYHEAWRYSKTNSVALYLHGDALMQAGQVEEGRRILSQARLLPLADTEERGRLAKVMKQRGLKLEAMEQWELILRLGAFEGWEGSEDWAVNEAAEQLGDQAEEKDQPGRAASLWQRSLFYTLKTNAGFEDLASYADIVNQIHRAKARDMLERGKVDEAVREIGLARAARPGDVELVEKTLPYLVKAGRAEVADKLFDNVYQALEQVCKDFPNSARHHNDLAWLAVCCNRRLDDALMHSQRAVELGPDHAGHLHTLAEVHFLRGERSESINVAKRGLECGPQNAHLQKQLQRLASRSPLELCNGENLYFVASQ